MHEGFLARDYPEARVLAALLARIPKQGMERSALLGTPGFEEVAETALGKLWIHGGVTVDAEDVVRPGSAAWRRSYEAIRAYRTAQLDDVVGFAQSRGCRMVQLVRYFGETRDARPCGACDACQPRGAVGRRLRAATPAELSLAGRIVEQLDERDGLATGTLLRNLGLEASLDRRHLERALDALARAGAVSFRDDEFEKDGKAIRFRRVDLRPNARGALRGDLLLFDEDGPAGGGAHAPKRVNARGRHSSGGR
jgi:hypothetical protein